MPQQTHEKTLHVKEKQKEEKRSEHMCSIGGGKIQGNPKENNCKLSIKQRTLAWLWSPFNPKMRVFKRLCAHNFSACVTPQELNQTCWETGWGGGITKMERGPGVRWAKENARQRPLVLKDGRGSELGVSLVTTSWVTEHDLLHLEPITQFLTTSWNTSTYFLHPSTPTTMSPTYLALFFFRLSFHRSGSLLISNFHLQLLPPSLVSSRALPCGVTSNAALKQTGCEIKLFMEINEYEEDVFIALTVFPKFYVCIFFLHSELWCTWNRLISLGFPAVFRQFWLHFRKNFKKNLQR